MIKHCIINVATGGPHVRGQERLRKTLLEKNYQGDIVTWTDEYPPGSPTHQQVPYAFKYYAFQEVIRRGYDTILWLDASFWPVGDPMEVMNVIDKQGYALWYAGWSPAEWASDQALVQMGLTRDEAVNYPLVMGGAIGISIHHPVAMKYIKRILAYAKDGKTFPGAWDNKQQQVSKDPRVFGHRHDQPPLGVEAKRFGLKPFGTPYLIAYWLSAHPEPDPRSIFLCKGML